MDLDFGKRLMEFRMKAGLSQETLGAMLDVSRQTIANWEKNNCYPQVDKAMLLCQALNVGFTELFPELNEITISDCYSEFSSKARGRIGINETIIRENAIQDNAVNSIVIDSRSKSENGNNVELKDKVQLCDRSVLKNTLVKMAVIMVAVLCMAWAGLLLFVFTRNPEGVYAVHSITGSLLTNLYFVLTIQILLCIIEAALIILWVRIRKKVSKNVNVKKLDAQVKKFW